MFFVLSGYLITSIMLSEIEKTGTIDLLQFQFRRLVPLYPAMLFLCGVFLVFGTIMPGFGPWSALEEVLLSLLYVMNWHRAFDWSFTKYFGHMWSLAIVPLASSAADGRARTGSAGRGRSGHLHPRFVDRFRDIFPQGGATSGRTGGCILGAANR